MHHPKPTHAPSFTEFRPARAVWPFFVPSLLATVLASTGCDQDDESTGAPPSATTVCEEGDTACNDPPTLDPVGLRADAPPYAVHGPFWVGFRTLEAPPAEGARELAVKVWYPALNPALADEEITYEIGLKMPDWQEYAPSIVKGHALRDAPLAAAEEPFPVVVFSHGFITNPEWYAPLVEHYASQGFVVLAPEHDEDDWLGAMAALFDRPADIRRTLDFAETLAAPGGDLDDALDLDHIALVGHSFGGYTALAMAGARFDLAHFNTRCGALAADAPEGFLCAPFVGTESEMATRMGLDAVPAGLCPSQGDPRITAIVPMAGDAYLFGEAGLENITVPMLALGGTADYGTPWEWGAKPAYDHATSAAKSLVGFANANHMIATSLCEDMPWTSLLPPFEHGMFCLDPVWDKERALDLINHFSTAFLRDVLVGDPEAHAALLADSAVFPGIEYATTLE